MKGTTRKVDNVQEQRKMSLALVTQRVVVITYFSPIMRHLPPIVGDCPLAWGQRCFSVRLAGHGEHRCSFDTMPEDTSVDTDPEFPFPGQYTVRQMGLQRNTVPFHSIRKAIWGVTSNTK
jgi:hypothetical protein